MSDELFPCPHCGGTTERVQQMVLMMENRSDGTSLSFSFPDNLGPKTWLLRCLECDRQFTERHAKWADTGSPDP